MMLDTLRELFDLGKSAPTETGLHVHREPNTARCSHISSIGLVIRSVKVELLSYKFNHMPQYLVILHFDSGSSVLTHNDRVVAEAEEVGRVVAALIHKELEALLLAAQKQLLAASITELQTSTAIRQATIGIPDEHADEFILQATGGNYATAYEFINDFPVTK